MTTNTSPVVLLSIPHGAAAGNILRRGLLDRLLAAAPSIRIVLLSPLVKDSGFVSEFSNSRVSFEDLPLHVPTGMEARLRALIQAGYLDSGISESVKIRKAEALEKKTIRWIRAKRLLAGAIAPSMIRKASRYALSDRLVSHPWVERLFDRYRPALLVASSPGLILSEVPLLRTAVRRRVRSVVVDPSWDNFTNKLMPVRRVDRLIVWNDLMKSQAVSLHGYQPDEIRVAGAPQFDLYFHDGVITPRDVFLRGIGGDPDRRLITLTTTPLELYSHYDHIIRRLIREVAANGWKTPSQILVRVHPRDDLGRYKEFDGQPHVIIEKPFRQSARAGDGMAVDVTVESQRHLANTMRHSDVIVSVASTIAIEAAIFDTPIVNVAFDGDTPSPFARSARRYLRFTHFANVTSRGAVSVANTPEEMVAQIGRIPRRPFTRSRRSGSRGAGAMSDSWTAAQPSASRRLSSRSWPTPLASGCSPLHVRNRWFRLADRGASRR